MELIHYDEDGNPQMLLDEDAMSHILPTESEMRDLFILISDEVLDGIKERVKDTIQDYLDGLVSREELDKIVLAQVQEAVDKLDTKGEE